MHLYCCYRYTVLDYKDCRGNDALYFKNYIDYSYKSKQGDLHISIGNIALLSLLIQKKRWLVWQRPFFELELGLISHLN